MSSATPPAPRPLHSDYELVNASPSLPSYLHLRTTSGLSPKSAAQAQPVLSGGSWFFCHIVHKPSGTTAAMGRIIGDGGWYFHIADMAVLPDHQKKGLGDVVLRRLLKVIEEKSAEPDKAYITLLADEPGRKLYSRLGFVDTMPHSLGMVLRR